jgi:outer membrane protein assembly factor BamB
MQFRPFVAFCVVASSAFFVAAPNSEASGSNAGLIVHLHCGDGSKLLDSAAEEGCLVHGLDVDRKNIATARENLRAQGVYGKVSVDTFDGVHLPYADNLVNAIVADELGNVTEKEAMRALAPGGALIVAGNPTKKPRPEEIDDWTHYLHDASNNAVAQDTVVAPPERFQWIAGPQWDRNHDFLASLSALVSANGRLFYIVDEASIAATAIEPRWFLVARDAFSGVELWKRPIGPWEGHLRGFRSGPTELARRLVAVGDRVYVTLGYGKPVTALCAKTGETLTKYANTDHALEIIHHDQTLFVVVGDRLPDNTAGAAKPENPQHIWHWWSVYEETPPKKHLVALDASSGKLIWKKNDADTVDLMPTTLSAAGPRVFFHSSKEVVALDAKSGEPIWRVQRAVSKKRPSWSAPSLVVVDDVLLCGDRAVESPPDPDLPNSEQPTRWTVNSHGGIAPAGQITALDMETGKQLWTAPCKECYNAPVDVLVADGLVWSGNLVSRREAGITAGLDLRTGEVRRTRTADQNHFNIVMGHHRCYRNKATEKYLVLGRDGTEFIDVKTGQGDGNAWVRGTCQYGVMPCNGLVYIPPHSCACHITSKLNGFNALAGGRDEERGARDEEKTPRLEKGAAYDPSSLKSQASSPFDWPTYRSDARRTGSAVAKLPTNLQQSWRTPPGGKLSAITIADGKAFVAQIDQHTLLALDAETGAVEWTFTAGGRIDSPPTIHHGRALFGCADGWIYNVDAINGQLAWRYHIAPRRRHIVSYDQLESAWPIHGSVLVVDDVVFAVAGRTPELDGGMLLVRLHAGTGELLSTTPVAAPALPDVLSCDGDSVYLRHKRYNKQGVEQTGAVPHLYSPAGFLDDSWWHRTYWQFGTSMGSGWGGWPNAGNRVPSGRLLVMDDATIYGFGRFNQYHRDGSHVGIGRTRYLLYATEIGAKPGKQPKAPAVVAKWSTKLPMVARGMLLADDKLFVAGPPDVVKYSDESITDRYHVASPEALREQEAAFEGKRGAILWAVSAADGTKLSELKLDSPPVFDGMAAAGKRLFISLMDGSVVCFE